MGDLHLNTCLLYLDDIIVFSKPFEEHLIRLDSVFQCLKNANLTLKPSKCYLFSKTSKVFRSHCIRGRYSDRSL